MPHASDWSRGRAGWARWNLGRPRQDATRAVDNERGPSTAGRSVQLSRDQRRALAVVIIDAEMPGDRVRRPACGVHPRRRTSDPTIGGEAASRRRARPRPGSGQERECLYDDSHDEGSETFTVTLSNASSGRITDRTAPVRSRTTTPCRQHCSRASAARPRSTSSSRSRSASTRPGRQGSTDESPGARSTGAWDRTSRSSSCSR